MIFFFLMIRPPPSSTRAYTLCPTTTLCRSHDRADQLSMMVDEAIVARCAHRHGVALLPAELVDIEIERGRLVAGDELVPAAMAGGHAGKGRARLLEIGRAHV